MARDDEFRTGPPSRKRPSSSSRRRNDDDDYDDDRPSRRRQSQSNAGLWIGLGIGAGLLLVAIIVVVVIIASRSDRDQVVVHFDGGGGDIQVKIPKNFPNFPNGKFPNPGDFPNPFPNGKIQFPNPGDFPFPGGIDQRAAKIIPGDRYAFIQAAVKEKRLADVNVTGFKLGQEYRDVPQEGALLIGFQAGQGKFIDNATVNALRPIYLTRGGEKLGNWLGPIPANPITVKAKPGYVRVY
jgi:hypothetical protein